MQLNIFEPMIYHHPYRAPVKYYEPINKHTIPDPEIRAFISGQAERLTAIYTEREQVVRLNTKKYSPFHGE
jgi:hypothetical protein